MAERQVTVRVKADGSNVVQTFRLMGKEGERALGQIRAAAGQQTESLGTLGKAMGQTRSQSVAFNGGMRGVALQLSQVGQQTIATGDFVKSLAIQLPDLALGFGTVGIAAGVVAGVVLPLLAGAIFDTEKKGGDLEDRLKELDAATKSYQGAVERLRSPLTDLREEFGQNAEAARSLFNIQRQQAEINLLAAQADARARLAGQIGADSAFSPDDFRDAGRAVEFLTARLAELRAGAEPISDDEGLRLQQTLNEMGRLSAAVSEVSVALGVSSKEAGELLASFAELNAAQGPQQQLEAVGRLRDLYFEAAKANGEISDEENKTLDALFALEESLLRVIAGTDQVTGNTAAAGQNIREMADQMSRAASEAIRFVSNLGTRSLAGVRAEVAALEGGGGRVAGQVARREADIRSSAEFQAAMQGPEGLRRAAIEGLQRELDLTREAAALDERRAAALRALNETRTGGGGGAARSLTELNEAARQTEALIRQAQQAAVGYADVVALLDEALRAGKISQEDYNRALELAQEKFEGLSKEARAAQGEFKSLVGDVLTGARSMGDALEQLGNRLISQGLDGLLSGIFSGGGSGGGGAKGLFGLGGFLGFLDGGGRIGAGQFAVVGERRPEIVTGPAQVIGGAQTARMLGGAAPQPARVEVVARVENGNIVQTVRQIAGNVAVQVMSDGLAEYDRSTLPGSVNRINKDPRRVG